MELLHWSGTKYGPDVVVRVGNDPVDLSIKKAADSLGLISQTRSHQTVAANFYYSLADLMGKLLCGEPHFVRCIKPNDRSLPQTFDSVKVCIQILTSTGARRKRRERKAI